MALMEVAVAGCTTLVVVTARSQAATGQHQHDDGRQHEQAGADKVVLRRLRHTEITEQVRDGAPTPLALGLRDGLHQRQRGKHPGAFTEHAAHLEAASEERHALSHRVQPVRLRALGPRLETAAVVHHG